jgi:hypothetical protein
VGLSSLSGPDYARNTHVTATQDDAAGRWVATDESGWDGEQLYGRDDRYLSIGSVAIDDGTAAQIVDQLRRDARLSQPPELKFAQFAGQRNSARLEALATLLGAGGALAGRARVYLVDKHYFVAGKIIDLLLEEGAHARGINLHEGGLARRAAWTLFTDGPRALGGAGFDRVIATMVGFASARNRDGSVVSVDALFGELRRAFGRARRGEVSQILGALLRTREQAEDFLEALSDTAQIVPAMEPLIPALPLIANLWSDEIGALTMLTDEHKVLTDDRLDFIARVAALDVQFAGPGMGVRQRAPQRAVRAVVRGVSRDHPSIQLADLVAGSGQAVARRHAGVRSPAGERLYPLVVPLISPESLVPHDEPTRFATIDQTGSAASSAENHLAALPRGCGFGEGSCGQ